MPSTSRTTRRQPKTRFYRVEWAIDIEARSPEEAARQALIRMHRRDHEPVFEVSTTPTIVDTATDL